MNGNIGGRSTLRGINRPIVRMYEPGDTTLTVSGIDVGQLKYIGRVRCATGAANERHDETLQTQQSHVTV